MLVVIGAIISLTRLDEDVYVVRIFKLCRLRFGFLVESSITHLCKYAPRLATIENGYGSASFSNGHVHWLNTQYTLAVSYLVCTSD